MPRIRNDNTKELLLQQGAVLLREKGYHGTGLKEILGSVNVPKGSFYHYFDSKEEYVAEVVKHYAKELKQVLRDYLNAANCENSNVLEQIKAVYFHVLDTYEQEGCRNGCLIGDLAAEVANTNESLRVSMQLAFEQWQKIILNLIKQGQETGDIRREIKAEELTHLLWSTFEGSLLHMKIAKQTTDARRSLTLLFDNVFVPK